MSGWIRSAWVLRNVTDRRFSSRTCERGKQRESWVVLAIGKGQISAVFRFTRSA
jgi:hypothetical protein